jgi:DeoR family transcriptional regulator, fructose operon transcriptional repressor
MVIAGPKTVSARQLELLGALRTDGYLTYREIAARWKTSTITARRDVDGLNEFGVAKFRGGAGLHSNSVDDLSAEPNRRSWTLLAERCLDFVHTGMSIGLCAGPHDLALARALVTHTSGVTVVTNSSRSAKLMWHHQHNQRHEIDIVLLPGSADPTGTLGGPLCVSTLEQLSLNVTFASPAGLDIERGRFTDGPERAETVAAFHSSSARTFYLVSQDRVQEASFVSLGPPKVGDTVITCPALPEESARALTQIGYEIVVA